MTSTHEQTNSILTFSFMLFFPRLPPHVTASRRFQSSQGSLQSFIHESSTPRSPHDLLEPLQRQQLPSNPSPSSRVHQQTHPHLETPNASFPSSRRPQLDVKTLSVLQHALNDIPDVFNRPTRRQHHCCCTIVDELLLFLRDDLQRFSSASKGHFRFE